MGKKAFKAGLARAKKHGKIVASGGGGGGGKALHRGLQLGGTALLLQSSKHIPEIPLIKCKPDTLATILGVVGVIALRKKSRKYAEDMAMAGANALLGRWTYSDKIELFVSGSDVKMGVGKGEKKEAEDKRTVRGSVRVGLGEDGRPGVEVRAEVEPNEPEEREAEVIDSRKVA